MRIGTRYNIDEEVITEKDGNGTIVGIHIEVLADRSTTISYDVRDAIGIVRTHSEHTLIPLHKKNILNLID